MRLPDRFAPYVVALMIGVALLIGAGCGGGASGSGTGGSAGGTTAAATEITIGAKR